MRKVFLSVLIVFVGSVGFSKDDHDPMKIEALVNSLTYEHSGTVILRNGVGKINIPPGYKYLEPSQAEKVLTELWGNPKSDNLTLGLLMPENQSLINNTGNVINIQYDDIGYVKDDDADAVNYSELLTQMQEEAIEENEKRQNAGYEPITLQNWAFQPYYDKSHKILHCATIVRIGSSKQNTLNYKVKILGRTGVLVLHAIAPVSEVGSVKAGLSQVVDHIGFSDAYLYESFNPQQDKVAKSNIGALVAGNMLNKIDFLALFSKYWTLLVIAFIFFYRPILDEIRHFMKDERKLSMD